MQQRALVVIPARMQASRLPGKPLVDIAGEPLIVHVWRCAMAAEVGRVVVATDTEAILAALRKVGGEAVMTRPDHASGSDRVFEAVNRVDPDGDFEIILNLQGDLPTFEPSLARECLAPLHSKGPDIATLAAEITDEADRTNPEHGQDRRHADRRAAPAAGSLLHARDRALWRGSALPPPAASTPIAARRWSGSSRCRPSTLEKREQLEQLRALEDGMRIDVTLVDSVPVEVNTPADLERARRIISGAGRA